MPSPALRILWITPRSLSGTPDGARHATLALVRHLARQGVSLDVLSLPMGVPASIEEDQRTYGLRHLTQQPRTSSYLAAPPMPWSPWTFRTFLTGHIRSAVRAEWKRFAGTLTPGEKPVIVFDGLHTASALSNEVWQDMNRSGAGWVYRAHNYETELWEQCVSRARTPFTKVFFRIQTALVRHFEGALARRVNAVIPVSEEDATRFGMLAPQTPRDLALIGMDFPMESELSPVPETAGLNLLFLGRLDWLPNRAGLEWFLQNVWDTVSAKRPNLSLTIAGMGDSSWLAPWKSRSGIRFLGEVAKVAPLYQDATLAIAPLFQGSGTRVKIIEASRFGRATLSTALGAQGSGLEPDRSFLRAETSEQWKSALLALSASRCREIGLWAFRAARSRFDAGAIAAAFEQVLRRRIIDSPSGK